MLSLEKSAWGAYIHLPWCRYRCPYCAFAVDARKNPPHARYEEALLREWSLKQALFRGPPSSIYFGGGTPSRSPPSTFLSLLTSFSPEIACEITAEANPEDVDLSLLQKWKEMGINRLSLGVQSFFERTASKLGRRRGSRAARNALLLAQQLSFPSISVDLIFGGPEQRLQDWEEELKTVVDLGVPHVSLYGLTQEEGTAFGRLGEKLRIAEEDLWRRMYDRAVELLEGAGIYRYEVSNFAREGHRSVHNQHYWLARPWVGLGAGAHSWLPDGRRTSNFRDVDQYLIADNPTEEEDPPNHPFAAWDFLWSMLRHVDGVHLERYQQLTGKFLQIPPSLLQGGMVLHTGTHLRLQTEGFPVADALARSLYRYNFPASSV